MSSAASLRCFAKNNERLLGIEMKKLAILLLVISMLSLTGCGVLEFFGFGSDDSEATEICEIANESVPTKITTEVSFVTNQGDSLSGYYVTTTDGKNTIFEYYYEKLATPTESIALGTTDRIIVNEGVIYYKDGVYYEGDQTWKPGSGTAFDLKFYVDADVLSDVTLDEAGTSLEAKVSAEDLPSLIGTDLGAIGDASVSISTNGVNLTMISVTCTTANGTMNIRTSYTYNPQDLFPDTEAEADAEA